MDKARLKTPHPLVTQIPTHQKRHSPYHRTGRTGLTTRPPVGVSQSSRADKIPLLCKSPLTTCTTTNHSGTKSLQFIPRSSTHPTHTEPVLSPVGPKTPAFGPNVQLSLAVGSSVLMSPPVSSGVPMSPPVSSGVPMSPTVSSSVPMSSPVSPSISTSSSISSSAPKSPAVVSSVPMSPPVSSSSVPVSSHSSQTLSPNLRRTNGDTSLDSLAEKVWWYYSYYI